MSSAMTGSLKASKDAVANAIWPREKGGSENHNKFLTCVVNVYAVSF